ncbi:glycosyltransferase [Paraflavitalea sp. CAU 1676]|uniref:glycosyltransferase n=1 Tax=Paraflavitalea sp. CAU 1676 TaxID=3032598 RepID=UPI0023DA6285|nr:glycosyltransferase [Paraflavitalea sp. CAU 1676]MDF2188992.1 glycosyltransferase [Paraflavitalea sp. CAU 1676]
MKQLVFPVTNDLNYDQRMIRICTSLSRAGYAVTLIGRHMPGSVPLVKQPFRQRRLRCFFTKGKGFYIEYNIRLFFFLIFNKIDVICAVDLDTILPCYWVSVLKRIPRVYDAHELFCEMKEVVTRPVIYRLWKRVERFAVPRFKTGYTVNQPIAQVFKDNYQVDYEVVRNVPVLQELNVPDKVEKYVLYQGWVNEGRSFETLIPAMAQVDAKLIICGDGNFMAQARALVAEHGLAEKVIFKGRVLPQELCGYTVNAWIGVTLFENKGLSNYYSLANRFFDYMQAGIPQLAVDYPVYREINNQYPIAVLINDLSPNSIAVQLNRLLNDEQLYRELQQNCLAARTVFNWQQEEKKLIAFYSSIS